MTLVDSRFRVDTVPQNWTALAAWLHERGMVLDPEEPRQFASGLANLNYLISVDGRPVVLRRPPGGQVAEGASDMAREFRVLSNLHTHFRRAPRAVAFCDDPTVLGGRFQLIEYRTGTTFSETVPDELSAVAPATLADQFITALADLHTIDLAHHPELAQLGRPSGFITRQLAGWDRRMHSAYDGSPPTSGVELLRWLTANQPSADIKPAVLHNDYKFDNVLFDATGAATTVIDWDMSTLGDPLFDLGITLSYWAQPGDHDVFGELRMAPSLQPGFPNRSELATRYFAAAGREPVPLGFYLALGRLRLAVAWQQMYVLYRAGALVGPRYAQFADVASTVLTQTVESLSTEQI